MADKDTKTQETKAPEKKDTKTTKAKPQDPTIEEHALKLKVPSWAFEGAKVRYGWGQGKRMSEAEFARKIKKWQEGSMA